jgi:hypothetical protein
MDNLIICDRCGSDACYVQEVTNEIKSYSCFGCGFITNTVMTKDSEFLEEQLATLPDLHKELMGEDEHGKVWMPNTVNVEGMGMVFADGSSGDNWKWAGVLSKDMDKEEISKFKSKGSKTTTKMDMSTIQHFNESDYMEALTYIGILPS